MRGVVSAGLPYSLLERVLERLRLSALPSASLDGLRAIYRAWCLHVPFDNVRKMIALRDGAQGPLPGASAEDFFENWLAHGTGGTCWATSNALYALVRACGFTARRVAASMGDTGLANHGSVIVTLDGCEWLVDTSAMSNVPLPLAGETFILIDFVYEVELEFEGQEFLVWAQTPPSAGFLPCRYFPDAVSDEYYAARYEDSRLRSPFNQMLYARRNRPDEMIVLIGNTRFSKRAFGLERRELTAVELCDALQKDLGLSGEIVVDWISSGALTDSLEGVSAVSGETRKPPSQRGADSLVQA